MFTDMPHTVLQTTATLYPGTVMFTHMPHTVLKTTATLYPGTACLPTYRIQSYRQPPRSTPEQHVYPHTAYSPTDNRHALSRNCHVYPHAAYSPTDNRHAVSRNCMFTHMPHTVIQTTATLYPGTVMFTLIPHTAIQTTAALYPGSAYLPTYRVQSYRHPYV